ncbi:MAG: transcription termination/antitermination NusG family protein [bacterium]
MVYTKPISEEVARRNLESREIEVFLPKIEEPAGAFARAGFRIVPMFAGYLFARLRIPEDFYTVIWARGVKRIISNADGPLPLDDGVVDFLKERTGAKGYIRPDYRLDLCDRVRVKKGPFEGLLGVVQGSIDKHGRIRVLMDLLGRRAEVQLPSWQVEKTA